MTTIKIDEIDKRIINELQKDCKQSVKELSTKLNLSITPIRERIKRLENDGVISGYVAKVNPDLLGAILEVYCTVTLIKHQDIYFKEFEDFMATLNEVEEIIYVSGSYDYLLKVRLNSMSHFQDFITRKISRLDIISNIQSSFVIKHETKVVSYS